MKPRLSNGPTNQNGTTATSTALLSPPWALVVGNYCHDVLIREGAVLGESLGGAASFIASILDGLAVSSSYVAKVGADFAYTVSHPPIVSAHLPTTLFHLHLSSSPSHAAPGPDRALRRVSACAPITPSDLPSPSPDQAFEFGLAVGVAGEVTPETLGRMVDVCRRVVVDVQALIRTFGAGDGNVGMVALRDTGFHGLLPRIAFLKASEEEAPYVGVEEAREHCCVIVTRGEKGCTLCWKGVEVDLPPFAAVQIDSTGAGDSFLGGFVAGLAAGLPVPDAAVLGNFFGSLTVAQIGLPEFSSRLMEKVKEKLERKMQSISSFQRRKSASDFEKSVESYGCFSLKQVNCKHMMLAWLINASPKMAGNRAKQSVKSTRLSQGCCLLLPMWFNQAKTLLICVITMSNLRLFPHRAFLLSKQLTPLHTAADPLTIQD